MRPKTGWPLALLLLALGAGALAASRVAMLTQVSGAVTVGVQPARTLMPLSVGAEIVVPKGAAVVVTFFTDGHREQLKGPCKARVDKKGCRLLQGAPGSLQASAAAPSAVLAPAGQNTQRMGGALHALADPSSREYGELVALVDPLAVPSGGGGGPPMARPVPAPGAPPGEPMIAPRESAPQPEPPVVPEPGPDPVEPPKVPEPPPQPVAAPPPPPPPPVQPGFDPTPGVATAPQATPTPRPAPRVVPLRVSRQAVFTGKPTFSWEGTEGPYELTLRGDKVTWHTRTKATLRAYDGKALAPGRYRWEVRDGAGRQGGADFSVLPAPEQARIQQAFEEAGRLARTGGPSPWVLLMNSLAEAGLYDQALRAAARAQALSPGDPTLHLARARLLLLCARVDEAREEARRGLDG